jgi:hypothetical protein
VIEVKNLNTMDRKEAIKAHFNNVSDPETMELLTDDMLEAAQCLVKQFYTEEEWEKHEIDEVDIGKSFYSITEYSDKGDLNHLIIHYILPAILQYHESRKEKET